MLTSIRGTEKVQPRGLSTFLAGGFRPFFLLGAIYGGFALATWLLAYRGVLTLPTALGPGPWWHGHEMLMGLALAAVSGFLLTAVPKWTKRPALDGWWLGVLVLAWIMGRVIAWLPGEVPGVISLLGDQLLIIPLALWVGRCVYGSGSRRNFAVPVLIVLFGAGDLAFHLQLDGVFTAARPLGLYACIYLIVILMVLISGRIIPAFTASALASRSDGSYAPVVTYPRIGVASVVVAAVALGLDLVVEDGRTVGVMAGLAAGLILARSVAWRPASTVRLPIVWILHAGHVWLIVGFGYLAVTRWAGEMSASPALHAFTAGAIGTLVLAVSSRASLGHAGRALTPSPWTVLAYVLVTVGALIRVGIGVTRPSAAMIWLSVSGVCWASAFLLFAAVYWPILTQPRSDGRPG